MITKKLLLILSLFLLSISVLSSKKSCSLLTKTFESYEGTYIYKVGRSSHKYTWNVVDDELVVFQHSGSEPLFFNVTERKCVVFLTLPVIM